VCLCSAQVVISNRTSSSNHLSRLLLELVGKGAFETAAVKGQWKGWMKEELVYLQIQILFFDMYYLPLAYMTDWAFAESAGDGAEEVAAIFLYRRYGRERPGTGKNLAKPVNGAPSSIGKFPTGKQDYLFRGSNFPGNFPVERTEKSCSIYNPTEISRISW